MTGGRPAEPAADLAAPGSVWVLDLDGVVWLSGQPIGDPGAVVARLRAAGVDVGYVTNNSAPTEAELVARLARVGIEASADQLVTSAAAAASLLEPGQAVCLLGQEGLAEALDRRGVEVRADGAVDAVVVGWNRTFDFDVLTRVAAAARRCGRLIATNEDPTHPTPDGLVPGSGALLAAVATASGVVPEVAGKPHPPLVALLRRRLGVDGDRRVVVVGDQPGTDGRLAGALDAPFVLVDSGVTAPGAPVEGMAVALRAADLAEVADRVLGPGGPPSGGDGTSPT